MKQRKFVAEIVGSFPDDVGEAEIRNAIVFDLFLLRAGLPALDTRKVDALFSDQMGMPWVVKVRESGEVAAQPAT